MSDPEQHNGAPTRRQALAGAAALAAGALTGGRTDAASRPAIPLGSAAQIEPFRADPRYREALVRYCDVVVPMNDLKWEALRHAREGFDFSGADELVGFARKHGKALRGHALLWGDALPPWAREMTSRAEAERELVRHIETVVDRYRGKIATWDVVNEVIAHDPTGASPWRDTIWQRLLGPDHVEIAFRTAARVDPAARLVLNDYDFEDPDPRIAVRRAQVLSIVRRLQDKNIPVHGIGMQAHLYAEKGIDVDGLRRFVTELDRLGLSVEVTELDVIDWKLPADAATRDRAAASLVSTFLDAVTAGAAPRVIVTWGLSDRYTWIEQVFPRADGGKPRPLPLDADYKPKPMMNVLSRYRRGTA